VVVLAISGNWLLRKGSGILGDYFLPLRMNQPCQLTKLGGVSSALPIYQMLLLLMERRKDWYEGFLIL
jgi:hypothetical protein